MKARRPRAIKPGSAIREIERVANLRRQIEREQDRHNTKIAGIAAQRAIAATIADPALREMKLIGLRVSETEERQRHRDKAADLERRIWARRP